MSPLDKNNPARVGNVIAFAALVLAFASWGLGAVHVYGNDKVATAERLVKAETVQAAQDKQIEKLATKVDALTEKVDRILAKLKDF